MKKLDLVRCDYTGGGIYVYSALFNQEVWLETDFDLVNSLDIRPDRMIDYGYNYDAHWKKPSVPYPTWKEILDSIRKNCDEDTCRHAEKIMRFYNPDLNARCIERND